MTPSLLALESQLTPAAWGGSWGGDAGTETGAGGDSRSRPKVVSGSETRLPPPAVPPCATNTARREPGLGNRWVWLFFFFFFGFFFFPRKQPRLLAVLQFLGTCRAPMGVKSCREGKQQRGAAQGRGGCTPAPPHPQTPCLAPTKAPRQQVGWKGERQFPKQQSVRPFAKQLWRVSTGRAALNPPASRRG